MARWARHHKCARATRRDWREIPRQPSWWQEARFEADGGGYSDVTPVRAPATTLSLFAALFGVFYTAIVVSVFVGLAQSARAAGGKE